MGQLFRIFVIALAVWLAILLLRRALRSRDSRAPRGAGDLPRMLPCARCGVHVPESQAVTVGGRTYCSKEHAFSART